MRGGSVEPGTLKANDKFVNRCHEFFVAKTRRIVDQRG